MTSVRSGSHAERCCPARPVCCGRRSRSWDRQADDLSETSEEALTSDDNTAVVRSLFDAFNVGDLARAAATVTDDFQLVDLAAGQTFHGPEGCRQWLGLFKTALPDARTEILNLIADAARLAGVGSVVVPRASTCTRCGRAPAPRPQR